MPFPEASKSHWPHTSDESFCLAWRKEVKAELCLALRRKCLCASSAVWWTALPMSNSVQHVLGREQEHSSSQEVVSAQEACFRFHRHGPQSPPPVQVVLTVDGLLASVLSVICKVGNHNAGWIKPRALV